MQSDTTVMAGIIHSLKPSQLHKAMAAIIHTLFIHTCTTIVSVNLLHCNTYFTSLPYTDYSGMNPQQDHATSTNKSSTVHLRC